MRSFPSGLVLEIQTDYQWWPCSDGFVHGIGRCLLLLRDEHFTGRYDDVLLGTLLVHSRDIQLGLCQPSDMPRGSIDGDKHSLGVSLCAVSRD